MTIERNVSLKPYNTFGIDVPASHLVRITDLPTLREALQAPGLPPPFVLSGGSNILLTQPLQALVLYIDTRGREIVSESGDTVIVRAMAGENWHELVLWTLEQGLGGLENLALIPGRAGTAPVQNIGAYGVELAQHLLAIKVLDRRTGSTNWLRGAACGFSYRHSRFKLEPKRWLILAVRLKLTRRFAPQLGYADLRSELGGRDPASLRASDVAETVMAIRRRKLPDPAVLGNAGSFFRNPVLPRGHAVALQRHLPGLHLHALQERPDRVKVPAAHLIEQAGCKGMRDGDAGIHDAHALVLVNHGNATAAQVLRLARSVQLAVWHAWGVRLDPEPLIVRG